MIQASVEEVIRSVKNVFTAFSANKAGFRVGSPLQLVLVFQGHHSRVHKNRHLVLFASVPGLGRNQIFLFPAFR